MKKSFLSISPIVATLVTVASFSAGCTRSAADKDNPHSYPEEVKSVAEAIVTDSASAFASAVSYPLERPYPLPAIPDSAAMVKYFPTMVDDSLRNAIGTAPDSLWGELGWRGWTLQSGEYFWIDAGKIYTMDYVSDREHLLLDSLRQAELASLVPSMREGWQPVTCVVDSSKSVVFRIDRYVVNHRDTLPDDSLTYRLAVYSMENILDSAPTRLLYGHLTPEGSMGNRFYHFGDSAGVTAEYMPDLLPEDSVPSLEMNLNGTPRAFHTQKSYWLDLVNEANTRRLAK